MLLPDIGYYKLTGFKVRTKSKSTWHYINNSYINIILSLWRRNQNTEQAENYERRQTSFPKEKVENADLP